MQHLTPPALARPTHAGIVVLIVELLAHVARADATADCPKPRTESGTAPGALSAADDRAKERAEILAQPFSLITALFDAVVVCQLRGDLDTVWALAERLVTLGRESLP